MVNLYGRSMGAAFPHRLLPRSKGGLFAWEAVLPFREVILVEGLFDLAALLQEGFRNTTCSIGTHLTPLQFAQLCDSRDRSVAIAFDHDDNQAGQQSAQVLAQRLHLLHLARSFHPKERQKREYRLHGYGHLIAPPAQVPAFSDTYQRL